MDVYSRPIKPIKAVSAWMKERPGVSQVFGKTGTARIIVREDCVW